jgi:catechol 2,3-dioxygenase-like lactoylglutathione lyase family enzyme
MAIRVTETIYYCRDLDRAVEFYQSKLGYTLIEKEDWGWACLSVDGVARVGLLLESVIRTPGELGDEMPQPRLAIKTDAIEAEIERLKANGVKVDELKGDPGTMRAVNFFDEDGNRFFLWDDGSGTL